MEKLQKVKKAGGLSGSTLKLIAITAMLIDHIGAALLGRLLLTHGYAFAISTNNEMVIANWMQRYGILYFSYVAMRAIGRIAFPIFIFLMIEGFQKTRNVKKYAIRLGCFALLSEIPFDLAFSARVQASGYQNVFFTLFIGLLTMIVIDRLEKTDWNRVVRWLLIIAAIFIGAAAAELMKTDYGATGVLCIALMFLFREQKKTLITVGSIAFLWEVTAPLAFIPIGFYNGKRGLRLKYVFYLFYPLHLLLIYFICMLLGIQNYAVV